MNISTTGMMAIVQPMPSRREHNLPPLSRTHTASEHKAIAETIERGTHDPGEVGVLCEKHRRAAEHPVPIHVSLGDHIPDRDVIPHDLGGYDVKR